MPIQVNARLADDDWERIVEAMPGVSNAERISQLVKQQLTLLDAQADLAQALHLIGTLLAPSLQTLRELGLRGKGSEISQALAQGASESAAILLSQADALRAKPDKTTPELETLLVQRWARVTIDVLRSATLDPASMRNHAAVAPEIQRVLEQARLLQQTTRA
ncbi:hypothetical protein ASA1KI_12070 [Opitutales bacterium ASA1]|uniref:hypothetical protein n=1 Tax=Congregicoccus parvus TaxID=3081749 RepID=UPI002B2F81AF|nr:hypothetical protein ASA1KI_12070 [Opitutales bacterium ASA1]